MHRRYSRRCSDFEIGLCSGNSKRMTATMSTDPDRSVTQQDAEPAGDTSAAVVTPAAPVAQLSRIQSIDVLRGVAVLGILVMNIQAFGLIAAAYLNPTALGELEGSDQWVWYVGHLLTDTKFITIFSMLFGAGIVLMTSRTEALGRSAAGTHYRRMGWLVFFGLVHGYLLWYGDILYGYGMCGLFMYLFRKLHPVLLIFIGLIGIGVATMSLFGLGQTLPDMPAKEIANFEKGWTPTQDQIIEEQDAYRGEWQGQVAFRAPEVLAFQTFIFIAFMVWHFGGVMLIGMALFKWGVFSAECSRKVYWVLVALAAVVGLPLIDYGVQQHEAGGWALQESFIFGPAAQFNRLASPLVSLGWIGLVMLACKTSAMSFVTRRFAAVGQMALTNYLMQTIICTTIFYGHGFAQFGHLTRTQLFGIVIAVWIAELIWSPMWLARYRFGPFEWLWRSLTYWSLQPMRRDPA